MDNSNESPSKKSALCVFVRVRPIREAERQRRAFECVSVVDNKRLLLVDPDRFSTDVLRQHRAQEREFRFDAVVGPEAVEDEVQSLLGAEGLVDQLVRHGHNGTVLAYGPTGTGKTYTMVGTRQQPGLMMRMTRALYDRLAETGDRQIRVYISFMELYNELIRDLLRAERSDPLDLLEDERGNVHVPNLSRVRASNSARLLQLLQEGNARRTQEPTAANATSSRSHALLMISLWRGERQWGKLFLIDLAGSERAAHTQNQGQRLKEGAAINRSLLALGNVINALTSVSDGRRTFVNFRDSKLTRLLKDSLGGVGENGARTVLIAHISPSSTHYSETFNTLTYASRAKNINSRLSLPPHRPASADRPYSDALATLRREAERAGRTNAEGSIGHSASTGELSSEGTATDTNSNSISNSISNTTSNRSSHHRRFPPPVRRVSPSPRLLPIGPVPDPLDTSLSTRSRRQQQQHPQQQLPQTHLPRLGTSLFDSLRDQYLAISERHQRLRERLLRANTEYYELEMARRARMTILEAWKERGGSGDDAGKYERVAERVSGELADREKRISELMETRSKLEKALRRGEQGQNQLENRMRGLAKDRQQVQVVELVRTLARQQAERAAIHSDFAIQNKRVRRQESQLRRMRRYERVADKLIGDGAELDEEESAELRREYRMLRDRLDLDMATAGNGLPSWNAQIFARMSGRKVVEVKEEERGRRVGGEGEEWAMYGGNADLGKTFTVLRSSAENNKFPGLNPAQTAEKEEDEAISDSGENQAPHIKPDTTPQHDGLPPL